MKILASRTRVHFVTIRTERQRKREGGESERGVERKSNRKEKKGEEDAQVERREGKKGKEKRKGEKEGVEDEK